MKNQAILAIIVAIAMPLGIGVAYLASPKHPATPQPRFTPEQIEQRQAWANERLDALDLDIELTNRRISAIRDELRTEGITAGRVALLSADLSEEMADLEKLGRQRTTAHRIFLRSENLSRYPDAPNPLWAETDDLDPRFFN